MGEVWKLTGDDEEFLPVMNPSIPPHEEGLEQVLCFPRELLHWVGPFPGGLLRQEEAVPALEEILTNPGLAFLDRPVAETSADWIQLIPYCYLTQGRRVFRYRRAGSEGRLDGLWSVGVGGHINPVDGEEPGPEMYWNALRRELLEEVGYDLGQNTPPPLSLLYDESNAVGKVHLAVVHHVEIPRGFTLSAKDPALAQGDWWPVSEVAFNCREDGSSHESWTRLVVGAFLS